MKIRYSKNAMKFLNKLDKRMEQCGSGSEAGACFTGTERKTRWRFCWCWISGIVAISINKEVAGCLKLQ